MASPISCENSCPINLIRSVSQLGVTPKRASSTTGPCTRRQQLQRAQNETKMLQTRYSAVPVAGTREAFWTLLTKGTDGPVSIVHFAGHGEFSLDTAALSSLKLQDGDFRVLEMGTQEVKLGKKSGCLVIFNACKTGATGDLLGGVGGWAQTILQQRFGGLVAPQWSVDDDQAVTVAAELFDEPVNRRFPVSEALLSTRKKYGKQCQLAWHICFLAT
jgi:CHAT domain-containing protein